MVTLEIMDYTLLTSLYERLCQHRWTSIAGMVGFHNNVGSAALNHWVSPGPQQIAFGRGKIVSDSVSSSLTFFYNTSGSAGFVAINNEDSEWTATFSTSLPAGTYCDVVSGSLSAGRCTASS